LIPGIAFVEVSRIAAKKPALPAGPLTSRGQECPRHTTQANSQGGCGKTSSRAEGVTSAAEAAIKNNAVAAALKRCASQNQMQHQVFPQPASSR